MKINKVVATDVSTNESQLFTFGTAAEGKEVVVTRGSRLNSYLEFCFEQVPECTRDVEVEFSVNGEVYSLARLHNDDGTLRTILKKFVDEHWQVVARSKAMEYVEQTLGESIASLLKIDYVNNKTIEGFHGDLKRFDEIMLLSDVRESIEQAGREAKALKDNALQRVRQYAAGALGASTQQVESVNAELEAVTKDLANATVELSELKSKQNVDGLRLDVKRELENAQQRYNMLMSRKDDVEAARERVKLRDSIDLLVPKINTLRAVAEQRAEYEKQRYAVTGELEWQENELASIKQQLEEKERQYALSQDKRNRIEAINNELAYISSLYERNKKLNESLLELNDKLQRLNSEKTLYANRLDGVEKSISEVRQSLDTFHIPARSVGELLEAVRIDVKIDEVTAQIEKLQSELAVKESQIAEKESNQVVLVKRFRAVAELDVKVTPIKAKDTILQVLEAKYSKLESINVALQEKDRNLERAMEDYKFRILQLEQSRSRLVAEHDKTLLRKQEEFKREVLLNSQKVYSDDASSVFAVSANFHDAELEALEQEITSRNLDRDLLLERAYQLEGAIREIKRHVEINNAEMATLNREKDNINKRYNEIVMQNSNEAVFNYLKALNSDNGTKYLLDIQQDAVRSESELIELKHASESLRAKLTALKSRLKYLRDTQSQLDDTRSSVDMLVTTNDKLKEELSDIGERLSAGYEQYKAFSRQLESIESKIDDVRGAIIEVSKTIKVNEAQIAASTRKAQTYAGSDDIEHAVANFRYELGDVESERQMLIDAKQNIEKSIFKKRIELEKNDWLYQSKCREFEELDQEVRFELNLKGLELDKITSADLDNNVEQLRKLVADYDAKKSSLAAKVANLKNLLSNQAEPVAVSKTDIEAKQRELEQLQQRQQQLAQQRALQMEAYVAASAARVKVTVAAAEARTLSNLRQTINHNEIVALLISDKIKTLLNAATQYLNAFTEGDYRLTEENYSLSVVVDGVKTAYDDLSAELKLATYVSLLLTVTSVNSEDGRWLIFDERLAVDKNFIGEMLLRVDNVRYVNSYVNESRKSVINS